jgi:hypothetical protein
VIFDSSWVRVPQIYGYHDCMKEIQPATCSCLEKVGPFFGSSKNIDILRYDDVLLWQAEALIQLGQQNSALPLINQLRTRAAASTSQTKFADGTNPSNYRIGYVPARRELHLDPGLCLAGPAIRAENGIRHGGDAVL